MNVESENFINGFINGFRDKIRFFNETDGKIWRQLDDEKIPR